MLNATRLLPKSDDNEKFPLTNSCLKVPCMALLDRKRELKTIIRHTLLEMYFT